MKKFIKNTIVAALATVTAVCAGAALIACDNGTGNGDAAPAAAKVTAVYIVDNGSAGTAVYKTMPMEMIYVNTEKVTLYDDNTYCFNVTSTYVTNMTAVKEGNDQVINRGSTELEFYGTYESETDSGITTLTLSKSTRVTILNTCTNLTGGAPVGYFDTAAWTDADTTAHSAWWNSFVSTEENPVELTAQSLLDKLALADGTEVIVAESGTFDYIACGFNHAVMPPMFGF